MDSLEGGRNAILLIFTAMAVGGALLGALVAWKRQQRAMTRALTGAAAIVAILYAGGVVAASAASQDKLLAPGETKWFCGFYLDCHLGVSVQSVERTTGGIHVLTLRLHNSAKNPNVNMRLYQPRAEIVDASGNRYARSAAAEAALASSGRPSVLSTETVVMHQQPVEATIAFDLPAGIQAPRLLVSEGWLVDKLIELALVDDENSFLHGRTYIALDPSSARTAAR